MLKLKKHRNGLCIKTSIRKKMILIQFMNKEICKTCNVCLLADSFCNVWPFSWLIYLCLWGCKKSLNCGSSFERKGNWISLKGFFYACPNEVRTFITYYDQNSGHFKNAKKNAKKSVKQVLILNFKVKTELNWTELNFKKRKQRS